MGFIRKCRMFFSMDAATILLLAEATVYLGWARFQLYYYPFARMAPRLGQFMSETDREYRKSDHTVLSKVRLAIDVMSRNTFWESKCLVQAVTAMKMLEKRGIESTLYLGTAKDEKSGKFIAHAWLRSGPLYVTGAEVMERFTVTGQFAKFIIKGMESDEA